MIKKACVFCGASFGARKEFAEDALALAAELVKNKTDLVYGGGNIGLMGAVADGVLALGGKVYGIIPEHLAQYEICHRGITELQIVKDMHERKSKMYSLADCFIALPGGIGTLEELFEIFTWFQLMLHKKPCAVLNTLGFYDKLLSFLQDSVNAGFLKQQHLDLLIVETDIEKLITRCQNFVYPENMAGLLTDTKCLPK